MLEAAAVLSTHSHVHAPSTIHVACCTWNVGNCAPDEANMGAWLVENCKPGADLYAVGVQEANYRLGSADLPDKATARDDGLAYWNDVAVEVAAEPSR